ncbi:MAG: hypothetical protein EAZ61_06685 [Oscillatoriales cyanobacterium]|nr:MAG: hypothetical protein EAZ61_06685 [Oscillatoriales cyanobacterium]
MERTRYILNPDEVIYHEGGLKHYLSQSTFLSEEITKKLGSSIAAPTGQMFSEDGMECMVLRFGSPGWQSGRLRCILEFEPDEEIETIEVETVETPQIAAAQEDSALETLRKLAYDSKS